MSIKFVDNSRSVLEAFDEAVLRALERCGSKAEGYAFDLAPADTGLLRNSITHAVDGEEPAIKTYKADNPKPGHQNEGSYSGTVPEEANGRAVYIGTNVEYAVYQEMGTGKHTDGGRPTPWGYKDAKGDTHWTAGNTAKPFIKPAVADHKQTYINIIKDELKSG